jgi:RHS repeat-associated protein
VTIHVATDQGAVLDIPLGVSVLPLTPVLATNPGSLNTGMVVGAQSFITFAVVNSGGAPSGDLQVSLPATSYLSLASPAVIPSLAPGASYTVSLELSPPSNLPLAEYQGTIAVSNASTGLSVPFTFTAVSSAVGTVHVLVDDDFTFDEAGSPRVQGATVNLLNPYDNTRVVATGVTDATGAVTFANVPAGPYVLQVQADGHSAYENSYLVKPGIVNNDEVFIQRQFVTYTWDVRQTTIQDTYQIKLETTFVTDVPAPVVTITGPPTIPTLQPGQSGTMNLTVTNHGLIAAQGVTLVMPTDPEYTFTALSPVIGTLPAETSVVVPVTVAREASQPVSTGDGNAVLTTKVEVPDPVGSHVSSTLYVDYSNTGTAPMPAPLLVLSATQNGNPGAWLTLNPALQASGPNTSAAPAGYSQSVEILASGATPGVLAPGESIRVPVYYAGWNALQFLPGVSVWSPATPIKFSLTTLNADNTTPANWSQLLASSRPQNINPAAWTTISTNLAQQLGFTSGGYVQLLDNEASYLGTLGENVPDVQSLWGFAVRQADNALNPLAPSLTSATDDSVAAPGSLSLSFTRDFAESISGRDTMGPLGMGWSTSWQTSASVATDGTVTITEPGGSRRVFQPDGRTPGHYFSQPGDTGRLTADGSGGYLLTESDGIATDFGSNGLLNYVRDTNGNRITAGYTAGKLTSLTTTTGQYIHIGYNAAGLISSLTDSSGRTTTYNYDSSNTFLTSVNGSNGQTTNYTYNTTQYANPLVSGAATQNTLQTITVPGGTHEFFSYDDQGRLTGTTQDGDAEPLSFAYSFGQVTTTNGTGDASNTYYNENGLVAKRVDALHHPTVYTYDANFNLTKITNAAGSSETFTYNGAGEVTSTTDFLGNTTNFAYAGPFNKTSSMTDANGNTTKYAYDPAGNLLSTTYADGSASTSTFNPLGEATSFVNANGQPIGYTYNAAGQVAQESFSDGSSYTYTYDARGNMLTAADSTGTTTFTYDPTTGLLSEVTYPGGMFLTFTYNAAGQRTQMVDQTGFTTNYGYDANGRLSELTDGAGNPIAGYAFDADGRLSEKTNGNGTYTTYAYDANGNVLNVINYAPDGSVNSRFDYTYNALGLETNEVTPDGAWTYDYDADGRLTHAVFASTNPEVPDQDLAYNYDAMGNRTSTVINGVTTLYATNNLNEYTNVGGQAFTYDADGNLTSDGTNTYFYNSLDQLVGVTGSDGTATYTYDVLGKRVASTTNGTTTNFLNDPVGIGNVVGEFTGDGASIANFVFGFGLTSQVTAGGSYYYDFDGIGSTVGVSGAAGRYVNTYSYLPFGQLATSATPVANPFQFNGAAGVMAAGNGLYDMRARSMDVTLGRFTSHDPLQINGGNPCGRRHGPAGEGRGPSPGDHHGREHALRRRRQLALDRRDGDAPAVGHGLLRGRPGHQRRRRNDLVGRAGTTARHHLAGRRLDRRGQRVHRPLEPHRPVLVRGHRQR